MSVEAGEHAGPAEADAGQPGVDASLGAVLAAGVGLFAALRRVTTGLLALLAAETRVLRASIALVLFAGAALVALLVSMWGCVVVLIGWAFVLATHSLGIALGLLIVLHLILIAVSGLAVRRVVQHAKFPRLRTELSALGHTLRHDVEKFQHAARPAPERDSAP